MLIGCNDGTSLKDLNEEFAKKFPLADLNRSLQLGLVGEGGVFDKNSSIAFYIYNMSNRPILIDHNANTKLFVARNSKWVEIENSIIYPDSLPLSPLGTPLLDSRYTWVQLVLSDEVFDTTTEDIRIRILVLGEIMEDDHEIVESVGAYFDILINNP
jgi:hypothetical protein